MANGIPQYRITIIYTFLDAFLYWVMAILVLVKMENMGISY